MPTNGATTAGAATYGELLTSSFDLLDLARLHACGPFEDAQEAYETVLGYRRFLGVAGRHLRLLAAPGQSQLRKPANCVWPPLPELLRRLTGFAISCDPETAWSRAADRLAVAHDLLATHIVGSGQPFSPDADVVSDHKASQAATTRLLQHTAKAVAVCPVLLTNASTLPHGSDPCPSRPLRSSLRQQAPRLLELIDEVMAENGTADSALHLGRLDALTPATPHVAMAAAARVSFASSMSALRMLRLISFRQSAGEDRTSVGSLHDLTRIGMQAIEHAPRLLPDPTMSLAVVRRAAGEDTLQAAGIAWHDAADGLNRNVRTLDRAPHAYADAAQTLIDREPSDPGLLKAVLAALPRLGDEAALAIQKLTSDAGLVTATRQPARFEATWRPLTEHEGEGLASRFTLAAAASRRANATLAQLTHTDRPQQRDNTAAPVPTRSRRRDLAAQGVRR